MGYGRMMDQSRILTWAPEPSQVLYPDLISYTWHQYSNHADRPLENF